MKAFLQSLGETIVINGDISITVLKIEGDEVFFEIDAPKRLSIEEQPHERVPSGTPSRLAACPVAAEIATSNGNRDTVPETALARGEPNWLYSPQRVGGPIDAAPLMRGFLPV